MVLLPGISWLAGCPFVFGPPDLSNVPPPAASGTGDTAGTTPTGATGATGDTGPVLVGPEVVNLQILPFATGLRISVTFTPAGALDAGGALLVDLDGTGHEAGVPGAADLVAADIVAWTVPLVDPCDGIAIDALSVSVRDSLGAVGPPEIVPYAVQGLGVQPEQTGLLDLGTIGFPVLWCGTTANQSDFADAYSMVFDRSGDAVIALSWAEVVGPQPADYDLILHENGVLAVSGYDVYLPPPELVTWPIGVGLPYDVRVQFYSGDFAVPWMLVFTDAPTP